MSYHPSDTICAIATAVGGAARGMVRMSGPEAVAIASRCFCSDGAVGPFQMRRPTAISGRIRVAIDAQHEQFVSSPTVPNQRLDISLPCDAFIWPTHRSYTREPVVELHTVGSRPLLEAVLRSVCNAGSRLAEPGEFTLRAFLAGRLDLTQAEAVLGVIDAQGEAELGAALEQLAGGLTRPLHQLRDQLLQLLAELEAGLDFVDEDIEFVTSEELTIRLTAACRLLDDVARQMATRHTVSPSVQIAILGPPNAGKSSLFNALVARYGASRESNSALPAAALVSPQCGTTRDYLTATISLDGIGCELIDTAGVDGLGSAVASSRKLTWTHPRSSVGAAAQAISAERGARSLIRAYCVEASEFERTGGLNLPLSNPLSACNSDVVVVTKCDLAKHPIQLPNKTASAVKTIATSSETGQGLADLCAAFRTMLVHNDAAERGQAIAATADRCRESIRLARTAIENGAELVKVKAGDELVAVELRTAIAELGKVVGAVYTDDLLDRIFKTFCIGK
jgi:tRNA modification GTPase